MRLTSCARDVVSATASRACCIRADPTVHQVTCEPTRLADGNSCNWKFHASTALRCDKIWLLLFVVVMEPEANPYPKMRCPSLPWTVIPNQRGQVPLRTAQRPQPRSCQRYVGRRRPLGSTQLVRSSSVQERRIIGELVESIDWCSRAAGFHETLRSPRLVSQMLLRHQRIDSMWTGGRVPWIRTA